MSDITIGALSVTGANFSNIGSDLALSGVSVTLDSDQVTFANPLPPSVVGLGGFKISLGSPAVTYTVESVESRTSLTLTSNYLATTGTVTGTLHKFVIFRIYALTSFVPSGSSETVQQGSPGTADWFRRAAASIINDGTQNILHLPEIVLPATTNSSVPTARYFGGLYAPGGQLIKPYPDPNQFRLNHETTPTSWPQVILFNNAAIVRPPEPEQFYSRREIDARFPSGLADQLLYFEEAGNVLTPLTLGSEFQITAGELEFSGQFGITRIQEEGSNLPQQNTLNFVGSAFTAADDAGNSRTNVSADSDLNALASNSTNGLWARTGAGAGAARTLQQPAAGITITNPAGTAGDPTLVLANDLAALEGLGGTGLAARTGSDAWAQRTLQQPAAGITITNPAGIAGDPTLVLANDLAALEGLGSTGIAVRTGSDAWAQRTITGTTAQISVADGSGASGNPTISLPTLVFLGTAGGAPAAGTLKGPDASGTNTAGAALDLAGGPGTGSAEPGLVAVRYPLKVGSGTTVQSLSSGRFPVGTSMFSITNLATAIANTTTETSLFTGASVPTGATRTIEAGMTAAGAVYRVRLQATITTTGAPNIQIRIRFGGVAGAIVADSTAFATPNNSNGILSLDCDVAVYSATSARCEMVGMISPGLSGVQTITHFRGNNLSAIDLTASRDIEVTAQWGTASPSNTLQLVTASIERIR
jgi:hypothetical protein